MLTDENDFLETGVDIIVQPPGKKLQSITLLSGGEKALTAVSLLFAIFLTKPSPFCFLDEVDAPLDDANLDRFTDMIKEMSEHSQFVLVTHNKKSMQAAEVLYGITMAEPGVSKVVSSLSVSNLNSIVGRPATPDAYSCRDLISSMRTSFVRLFKLVVDSQHALTV